MSSKIDQKEYLKKYLAGDVEKVKKKKKRPVTGQTVTIIDDDVDVSKMQHLRQDDVEILATGEDAPQVVGVIDERPPELRAQDFKNSSKWKIFADDNGYPGFESSLTVQQVDRKSGRIEKSSAAVESKKKSSSKRNKSPDLSPARRRRASSSDSSPKRGKSPDLSPKRKRNSRSTSKRGMSPPKRTRSSSGASTNGSKRSDLSPKRRRSASSDLSLKRKNPHHSPRRKRSPDSPQRRKRSPDSPPRRKRSLDSPPRRGKSPDSPPRRRRSPDSPPRRRNNPDSSPKRWRSPGSPPRRRRSPYQQEHNRSGEFSSGWKKSFSPKRFGRPNDSPPFRRDDKRNSFNAPYRNRNSSPDGYRNRGRANSPHWNQDRGNNRGNNRGFNRGFDRGQDRGFDRGQDRGFDRGYDRGFQHNTSNRGRDSFGWGGRGGRGGRGFDNRRNNNDNFREGQTFDRSRPRDPTPEWSPVKQSAAASRNRGSPQSNRPSQYAPPTGAPYGSYNTRKSPDRGRPGPSRNRNDYSPKNRKATPDWDESSPPRGKSPSGDKQRKRNTSVSPENTKMKKTLEGKTAGLQDAKSLRMETDKIRKRDAEAFNQMSDEVSGRNASMVMRDKRTGRIRDLEREAEKEREKGEKEQQKKDVYDRWGKGLKQVEDYKQKIDDEVHEMSKPLARYSDDADLDKYLKKQEREGDPMLEYMRQKEREKQKETKTATMPIYKGPYPENRLGIRPGYRWDGVDRSNGYEKKWFDVQNKKKAIQEEAYRYSTEDL